MSIILARPDSARARPSSLIKDDKVYSDVFAESYPVGLYTNAAALVLQVDQILKSRSEMTARDRSNLRFYVLLWLASMLVGKALPSAGDLAKLDIKAVNDGDVELATDEVWKLYEKLGKTDQVAKGPDLRKATLEGIAARVKAVTQPLAV